VFLTNKDDDDDDDDDDDEVIELLRWTRLEFRPDVDRSS